MHGCKVHAGKCRWRDVHLVDKILAVKGATGSPLRRFLIRWEGYGPESDTWEPRKNLQSAMVNSFLHANGLYDHNWHGARCPLCDLPCKSEHGVKIHLRSCLLRPDEAQTFHGTCAAAKVRANKLADAQDDEDKVRCVGKTLKNVFLFKYLGSLFAADGSHKPDVKRRIAMAMNRMGQLRHVFNASLPFNLKMKIYKTAVCSLLTYGSEAWNLDESTLAMLNGANARCLSRFTGKDAHAEASARSRSFDLTLAIRKRRFKWLGHILRMQGSRLVKLAVAVQHSQGLRGNIFMDIPGQFSFKAICRLAQNRKVWRQMSCRLDNKAAMQRYAKLFLDQPSSPCMSPRSRRRARRNPASPQTMATTTANMTINATRTRKPLTAKQKAARYRARDAHHAFFCSRTNTACQQRAPASKPKPKTKNKTYTDKQRRAFAESHYVVHHGTAVDAARLLHSNLTTAISHIGYTQRLQQMCASTGANASTLTASTTPRPPATPTKPATPTTSRPRQTATTAANNGTSPFLPPPTIFGHHFPNTNTLNTIAPHPPSPTLNTHHTHAHTYSQYIHPTLTLSPISHTHLNVLHHTIYDPHHITIMNETFLYINEPVPHSHRV